MTRTLPMRVVTISLCVGSVLAAATTSLPEGIWKLRSERIVAGAPPSFSPGLIMSLDRNGRVVRVNAPVPPSIVGHDRMKFTVSPDGRVLTQETKGSDQKTGKPYRYVLTWDKQ